MGSMADEMAARIEADGAAGTPTDSQPVPPAPAAAPSTPDSAGGQPPDTIPYARFKEVNDELQSLRPYRELETLGYDPDSLGRLVNFEANYARDPVATVNVLVDNLDLPDATKEAVKTLMQTQAAPASNGGGNPEEDGDGQQQLSPEVQEALQYVRDAKARDAQATTDAQLQTAVDHWSRLDAEDGLTGDKATPKHVVLMHIGALAGSGNYATLEALAEASRKVYSDERDRLLGSAVQTGRTTGSPARVPAGPSASPQRPNFGSLKEASKAALADIQAGRLPAMNLSNE